MVERTRNARRAGNRNKRWAGPLLTAAVVLGVLAIAAGAWGVMRQRAADSAPVTATVAPPVSMPASDTAKAVELPDVVGLGTDQARIVLETAGVTVVLEVTAESTVPERAAQVVLEQDPPAGTLVEPASTVTLVMPRIREATEAKPKTSQTTWVVCIDPGHQARSDSSPEPVGPGSKETKASVTGGASGIVTEIPEYEIALQISTNLKKRLEARGVKVVMTRTTNDVSLSNSERAAIANKAGADLFLRIHGDGSADQKTAGISTLYPGSNRWTKPFAEPSKRAALIVQKSLIQATGAQDRGIVPRQDISGFNWSQVPAVLVESGFLSNPVEDRLLASPHYQDKLAQGITDGVLLFLEQEATR